MQMPQTTTSRQTRLNASKQRLQKSVINNFLPRFGHAAEVLYSSDVQGVPSFVDEKRLLELGLSELPYDKLPDILAYSKKKNWLYFIKTVRSENPITEQSLQIFEQLTEHCTADIVYVSAFLSRWAFRKFACDIAWNTQVWTADAPEHTVHFAANESPERMFVHPPAQERRNMPL